MLMVHRMVGRGVEKLPKSGIQEPVRENLKPGMTHDIEAELHAHERQERNRMDRESHRELKAFALRKSLAPHCMMRSIHRNNTGKSRERNPPPCVD